MKTSQASLDLSKAIADLGFSMELTPARYNPMTKQFDYIATLSHGQTVIHVEFHTGAGWCELKPKPFRWNANIPKNSAYLPLFADSFKIIPPTLADVLSSLILDSSAENESFESWASDFGYDTDSRKEENLYRACLENAKKTHALLGSQFQTVADMLAQY